MLSLEGKSILVLGLARTGQAVARYCRERGAEVRVLEKDEHKLDRQAVNSLKALGIVIEFGSEPSGGFDDADFIIPSPGIPPAAPVLKAALGSQSQVISEIELAYLMTRRPIIAVTGTNGKTTTASLIGHVLEAAGLNVDICGNIGRPMIDALGSDNPNDPLVVEVSSFQLAHIQNFRPHVAVLLNLTPDHLDWHESLNAYVEAKMNIFKNQQGSDWVVIEHSLQPESRLSIAKKIFFGGDEDVFMKDGSITQNIRAEESEILPADLLPIKGSHNLSNAMAAIAVALIYDIGEEIIAKALRTFKGVEHRLELVVEDKGVGFYNDSKATNPEAAAQGVESFAGQVILLAGGRNKGNNFEDLARRARGRVKLAYVFGEAATDLRRAFSEEAIQVAETADLEEAVELAVRGAIKGDAVLLSPACASFDMFKDYEERGNAFKRAVSREVGRNGEA